ncbi:hypothetical protein [Haliangium sp.]|uniref:hypothetical protein n=1 Tax=Haliangium sp. TaxID=2663208 RepID=UPI003D112076
MKRNAIFAVLVAILLSSSTASAGVWFELLHAPCWTGDEDDINEDNGVIGEYNGAIDCFNKDFNGEGARTLLSIKAFQAWEYGTMFLYYDITGPFTSALKGTITDNEKGGFFGGTTVTLSIKQIYDKLSGAEQPANWGPLANLHLKYEIEHVSKFGALHYVGLQWDFAVPFLDFLSATTVIREDRVFEGVDLQVGAAWQKSFSLANQDFIFGGFFQWGLFGEGKHKKFEGQEGNNFFLTQPQLLWDFGKAVSFAPAKLYLGFEYQYTVNRYLIEGKSENMLQGMIRWNI